MVQHNLAMLNMYWRRQALSQGIRNHEMSTERHKLEDASGHHHRRSRTNERRITAQIWLATSFRYARRSIAALCFFGLWTLEW